MSIDACALVEPAIAEARIHANHQIVLSAVVQEISQLEAERRVAVVVAADEISVKEDECAAEGAIELDRDTSAIILGGNVERAAIPSNAGFGIAASERLVAVAVLFFIPHKGQLNRPVVRQVERAPLRVVEF